MSFSLILLLPACGGGGGGTVEAPTGAFLASDYGWTALAADSLGPTARAEWGAANAAGDALTSLGLFANDGGAVSGPHFPAPWNLTTSPGGHVTIETADSVMAGGVASDGSLGIFAETAAGALPGIRTLLRKGTGYNVASLLGDYHLVALRVNGTLSQSWFFGSAEFDGAGNCIEWQLSTNTNGVSEYLTPDPGGTYTVEDDGTMVWDPNGTLYEFRGTVGMGGEVAILGGLPGDNTHQLFVVLVRESFGTTAATFSGDYHSVAMVAGIDGATYQTYTGTSNADGASQWTLGLGRLNADGVVSAHGPDAPLNYTVLGDGQLRFNGLEFLGAVSGSGRFAVVGGGFTNDAPAIWMFVR